MDEMPVMVVVMGLPRGKRDSVGGNLPWTRGRKATRIAARRTASPATGSRTMRGPKKSETLEIRLPYALKQAFMARCQAQGRSASEALRGFIEQALIEGASAEPRRPARR